MWNIGMHSLKKSDMLSRTRLPSFTVLQSIAPSARLLSLRSGKVQIEVKMRKIFTFLFLILATLSVRGQDTAALDTLASDFWTWRARFAPFTGDDVNRIERPGGVRDWSRARIDHQRKELGEFEARWKKID